MYLSVAKESRALLCDIYVKCRKKNIFDLAARHFRIFQAFEGKKYT